MLKGKGKGADTWYSASS